MQNPLCQDDRNFQLPRFKAIEPAHVEPALDRLLSEYRDGLEKWLDGNGADGWTFVEAEIEWADRLAKAWSPVSHLNSVADDENLRKAYNAGLERLTEHGNWRQQHAGIYRAYRELRE